MILKTINRIDIPIRCLKLINTFIDYITILINHIGYINIHTYIMNTSIY